MANLVEVPPARIPRESLQALLEEFATRDGTDYGEQETSVQERVAQLQRLLGNGKLRLLFNVEDERWDIVAAERVAELLAVEPDDS